MKLTARLFVLFLCLFLALPASAREIKLSGRFYYYIENDGAVVTEYTGVATDLTVPDTLGGRPVVAIGEFAFWQNKKTVSITLPATVASIAPGAFGYCDKLRTIVIKNDRFRFEDGVLYDEQSNALHTALYAVKIETFAVPKGIKTISAYAFANHDELTAITLPSGLETIGDNAFMWCSTLRDISLPDSLTALGSHAFYFCKSLPHIEIPSGVKQIPDHAFMSCDALTDVVLPKNLESIGDGAFSYCVSLAALNLSHDTALGDDVFTGCKMLVID